MAAGRAERQESFGAGAVLAAAVLWGSIGVLSTGLFRLQVSPWEVAFWRAALSAAALLAYLLAFRPRAVRLAGARDFALLAGFGVVGVGLFYVSFQLATFLTSVAVAVVLLYLAPVFVMLGAALWLGERLDRRKLLMAALVVGGVWATALGATDAEVRVTVPGILWGLAAALSYSAYYLFGKRYVPRFGVMRTLLYSLLAGTLVLWPASALAGHPPRLSLPPVAWALLVGLSLGTTLLANGLYYWGLTRLEAGKASVLASVEPVVAAILALLLFGQGLSAVGWAGVGLVVVGILSAPRTRRPGMTVAPPEAVNPTTNSQENPQ